MVNQRTGPLSVGWGGSGGNAALFYEILMHVCQEIAPACPSRTPMPMTCMHAGHGCSHLLLYLHSVKVLLVKFGYFLTSPITR